MKPLTTSASDRTNLLAWALAYARAGWPVFPLRERGKEPVVATGFKVASTDHDVIIAWWSQFPNANIGVATGIMFDVLDIDGPEGRQSMRDFSETKNLDQYTHAGPVSLTGKGVHFLFAVTGSGNGTGLVDHVDFRGKGGYIVAPPSIHPLGHRYRWHPDRPATTELPDAPDWLLSLLTKEHKRPITSTGILRSNGVVRLSTSGMLAETRPDIVGVARDLGLDPQGRGHYHVVSCPFHQDDTPSMALYSAPQDKFYCYGCGAHGDSLDLSKKTDMDGRRFL